MQDLRRAFFENMERLAEADNRIILIVGDLGFSFYEHFAEKYPKQFLNAGCIEQSMVGIAAGMARGGLKPYVYSGTIFLLMRAYEQIRNDVCFNNTNVKVIGTKVSGFLGMSHNFQGNENTNDLLKNLPNIKQFYPIDEKELFSALITDSPSFIQL